MEEENKEEIKKNSNEKFIFRFILFLAVLITFTISAIYFTINYLKENNEPNVQNTESNVETNETKKVAEDSKYAIKAYTETYDMNSIKCTNYYDVNGKVTKELPNYDGDYINYIEIDGLKDTNIQAKINERLKQEAYKIKGYTIVTANFSNILSVQIWNDKEKIGINVNLSTGEDIPFEKLFIQSTPINSLLADGLNEKLAWNELYNSSETANGPIDVFDMKNADTSTYEDKFLMLINNYNKLKGKVNYNFYANEVVVYDLIDENIIPSYEGYDNSLTIDLTKYPDQVAIFKRYLTENSIYENDNLGLKDVIVLTNSGLFDNYVDSISYGKIADNIFVEEVMLPEYETTDKEREMFKKYCIDISNTQKNKLKKDSNSNTGIFYQREYYFGKGYDTLSDCYCLHVYSYQANCDISYFENLAFKDFIELKKIPRVQAGINAFMDYMKEDFPNLKILENKDEQYYYDKNGNFIGNSEEEAKSKLEINLPENNVMQENTEQENTEQENSEQEQVTEENQDGQDNTTNNTNITGELDDNNTQIESNNSTNTQEKVNNSTTENSLNNVNTKHTTSNIVN